MEHFKDFSKIFDDFSEIAATKNSIEIKISTVTNAEVHKGTLCIRASDDGTLSVLINVPLVRIIRGPLGTRN